MWEREREMWWRYTGGTLSLKLVLAYQFWTVASAFSEQTTAPIPWPPWGTGGSNLLWPRWDHAKWAVFKLWRLVQDQCTCCAMLSCFSCVWLCWDPMDFPPDSSVCGILQARILEWIAMPSSRGSSWPKDWTHISYVSWTDRQFLYQLSHWGSPKFCMLPLKKHDKCVFSWLNLKYNPQLNFLLKL